MAFLYQMTIAKEINFINLDGNVITSILLDDNFINKVNNLLKTYIGPNENYIKLIYNNTILNSKNIFCIDKDFNISDNINIIQVITSYKKYVYFKKYNNEYILNDDYYTDAYNKLLNCIKFNDDFYNYVTNTSYYDIVFNAVQKDGLIVMYTSENTRDDYDIVLAAVNNNSVALIYASENMKNNYNIMLVAVQKDGRALEYASENMKDN